MSERLIGIITSAMKNGNKLIITVNDNINFVVDETYFSKIINNKTITPEIIFFEYDIVNNKKDKTNFIIKKMDIIGLEIREKSCHDPARMQTYIDLIECDVVESLLFSYHKMITQFFPSLSGSISISLKKTAENDFWTWFDTDKIKDKNLWTENLRKALKSIKLVAETAEKNNVEGSYSVQKICNCAFNLIINPEFFFSKESSQYLGSSLIGVIRDFLPNSSYKIALSTLYCVMFTVKNYIKNRTSIQKNQDNLDIKILNDLLKRSFEAETKEKRDIEINAALYWAWIILLDCQNEKGMRRHDGWIGKVISNLEVAVQWNSGDLPDKGPYKNDIQINFRKFPKNICHLRATAFQAARGNNVLQTYLDSDNNVVGSCKKGEKVLYKKDGSAIVYDDNGLIIFNETLDMIYHNTEDKSENEYQYRYLKFKI